MGGAKVQVKGRRGGSEDSQCPQQGSLISHQVLRGSRLAPSPSAPVLRISATEMKRGSSPSPKGQISAGPATSSDKQMDFQCRYKVQS